MADLTPLAMVLAVLSGAIVGLLLAVFGGGGSVLATPLLIYLVGVQDPHVAIGTSAAAVAINALTGLAGHARGGRVKWPCALVFSAAGLAGSFIGSSLAKQVDGQTLLVFFAGAMAAIALSMLRKPKAEGDPDVHLDARRTLRLAPLGLLTGLAAGFFGIGGGFLIVPGLMAATGMTLANAAASSLVSVSLFGAATSANYALSGQIDWAVAGLFVLGGLGGGLAGLRIAGLLAGRAPLARRLFAGMIILVAAYVAWRGLSG
ncbi:sulfite exporter TauE/SafE family protein [Caulobacter sp. NIBR1757]|uniref:sulfite exporter TauE/SafE family protein n=1 Tax=Caulobacter sp. NIBR1757 TaxID=3016000 RepID=UPI0022F05E20|nr:sulfite exporter TauE/SafE family protein [Caulobacter sp. NIBR1757]WGM37664.1 putative membrane transporter protein [Caulobacter sp. NIBR1757]